MGQGHSIVAPSISLSKTCFALSQYMRQCPLFATKLTVQVLPQERRELYMACRRKEMQYGSILHNFAHMILHLGKSHFVFGRNGTPLESFQSAFGSSSTALDKLFSSSWARISALSMLRCGFPVLSEITVCFLQCHAALMNSLPVQWMHGHPLTGRSSC